MYGYGYSLYNQVPLGRGGLDPAAQAFITAAAITNPVQINAINSLVTGLKTDGTWSKMKAIYPFVGGTASAHKFNLKDPRDVDAAFRLVFNGGWTHSSTGATPNGTNGYADTKLIPNTNLTLNNTHLSVYLRNNIASDGVDIGTNDNAITSLPLFKILSRTALNQFALTQYSYETLQLLSISNTDSRGLFLGSRISSTSSKSYKNGNVRVSITTANNQSTISKWPMYLGASNNNGVALEFCARQQAFSSIGDGLTDTEAANLYTRVQAFQTSLSRQV